MSATLPLRTITRRNLQERCVVQRKAQYRALTCTTRQAFASTAPRMRGSGLGRQDRKQARAAVTSQAVPAPRVNLEKAQQDAGGMAEDIGLLQDTLVRARLGKLPALWTWSFWSYVWKVLKSKATALYTRSAYNRCVSKKRYWRHLPVDTGNYTQIKYTAEKLYDHLYQSFASGDTGAISQICLPPLARSFRTRIAARSELTMKWQLQHCSARIMSHRAQMLGDELPDTAYRQVIVRLQTKQTLSISKGRTSSPGLLPYTKGNSNLTTLKWAPKDARSVRGGTEVQQAGDFVDNGKERKVVEYLVLQKRVIRGREEENWKVWGFAQESTPEKIEEDELYWRKTVAAQAAEA